MGGLRCPPHTAHYSWGLFPHEERDCDTATERDTANRRKHIFLPFEDTQPQIL